MSRCKYLLVILLLVVLTAAAGGCGTPKTSDMSVTEHIVSTEDAGEAGVLGGTPPSSQSSQALKSVNMERKIIQDTNLDLRVQDVPKALEKISVLCDQSGGYTVNSHMYRDEERVWAELSIKVPQQQLGDIITSISQMGDVTDKVVSTQDVTEEFYDAEARLKVLKAKEERLLSLIGKAANINEIISVENELGKTRGDIEVLAGRLQYLTNATSYSMVKIKLRQGIPGTVKAPQGTMGKAMKGLLSSLNGLMAFASHTVVFFFIILPWLAVVLLLFLLLRHIHRKRKAARSGSEPA